VAKYETALEVNGTLVDPSWKIFVAKRQPSEENAGEMEQSLP
jgi:hypothetical protein